MDIKSRLDLTQVFCDVDDFYIPLIRDNLRKLSRCQENLKSDWGRIVK